MKSKLKSTTFWLSLITVLLNPIAWFVDYWRTIHLINYMVESGIDPNQMSFAFNNLPLTTIATGAVTAVTAYIGGNKGRNIAENVKKNKPTP